MISESRRPGTAELWMTLQGHIYMGAGRFPNKHGVRKLLNRRWNNKTNWTDYISERAIAVSITVNSQPVLLMSVYNQSHSGYADHHVEKAYRAIEQHTKPKRFIQIVGGDFNAELGLGIGLERSSVCRYTLNDGNKRGDWMKQWVMLQRFAQSTHGTQKRPRNKQRT